jgi:hypothetical protein
MRRLATPPVSIDSTQVRLRLLTESGCQGITNEPVFKAILRVSENVEMKRADGGDRGISRRILVESGSGKLGNWSAFFDLRIRFPHIYLIPWARLIC